VTVIITVIFAVQLVGTNPDKAVVGGIFVGTLSGFGLVVLFALFYLSTVKYLGEWLEMEQKDKGVRMPMTDEMLTQINSIGYWEVECGPWKVL
jgi:hypothetical protein